MKLSDWVQICDSDTFGAVIKIGERYFDAHRFRLDRTSDGDPIINTPPTYELVFHLTPRSARWHRNFHRPQRRSQTELGLRRP